jgi:hypothetical protein
MNLRGRGRHKRVHGKCLFPLIGRCYRRLQSPLQTTFRFAAAAAGSRGDTPGLQHIIDRFVRDLTQAVRITQHEILQILTDLAAGSLLGRRAVCRTQCESGRPAPYPLEKLMLFSAWSSQSTQ